LPDFPRAHREFRSARDQFPALRDKTFLDAACVSIAPTASVEAIQEFLELALYCRSRSSTLHHIAMDEMRSRARPAAARLINAEEAEIALVESTTHALNIAAEVLPLERGDRILIGDLEFMEVGIPWCQKRQQMGLEIDVVSNHAGQIRVEDIAERVRPRTKAVVMSSVQWSNGFRLDLRALSALCRERNICLVVDAIQQLGAIPIDVHETPIDILACGGHKWLNSPFGAGFLYVRRGLLPILRPTIAGYLSVETPEGGWGNYFQRPEITAVREYRFVEEARRFEVGGTSNYPGAIGLAASLQMINELGTDTIAQYILSLTDHLVTGLETLGLEVVTPREKQHRSGIITFNCGSREKNIALMEYLLDRHILTSVRYTSGVGGVRISNHFFNTLEDLDSVLEHTAKFLRAGL
jgi:cysteine desulfurase / selenocysteine lyase